MKLLLLLSVTIIIASCDNSEEQTLIGSWKTVACEQAKDINGNTINYWSKGVYEFSEIGTILFYSEPYNDSQCTIKADAPSPPNYGPSATFEDRGEVILQERINGHTFYMSMGSQQSTISLEAFYAISNQNLCFSNIFKFEPFVFGIFTSGSDSIDFEKCLSK
ncbi:MAG: hypothetical protein QM484_07440 [Woeseiaceae bacterium]